MATLSIMPCIFFLSLFSLPSLNGSLFCLQIHFSAIVVFEIAGINKFFSGRGSSKDGGKHCYLLYREVGQLGFTGSFSIGPSRRPDKATAERAGVDAALPEGCRFKAHERIKLWVNQIRKVRRGFSWKSYNSFEPSHPQIPNLHSNQSAYLCGIPRQATIHSRA